MPRLYSTPKIHKNKTPYPLRPIVNIIGAITYQLSKYLVEIIKPLLGKSDQYCKNSNHLAEELKSTTVANDEIIISHHVVSLFTKTPVDVTLKVVEERLKKDKSLTKRTKLTV